jgi:hypothetical protein
VVRYPHAPQNTSAAFKLALQFPGAALFHIADQNIEIPRRRASRVRWSTKVLVGMRRLDILSEVTIVLGI